MALDLSRNNGKERDFSCPHCDQGYDADWYGHDGELMGIYDVECFSCKKPFEVFVSLQYDTTKIYK